MSKDSSDTSKKTEELFSTLLPARVGPKDVVPFDPLKAYLREIKNLPILSREEEKKLALKYVEDGDQEAGYKLVLANLRLVVLISKEYKKNVHSMLDLIQEGNLGLLEALTQYDPFKGTRFPSYAAYWIRAYILRYLINNVRLVKIGTTQAQRKLFFNLNKEKRKLEAEGFNPEARLLAKRLNVKESEVVEMESRLSLPDLSVDAPARNDGEPGDERDLHSVLSSDGPSLEETVADEQFDEAVRKAVEEFKKSLDDKEIAIVERRLFVDEPDTLKQVGDSFGLSRERIRQIEVNLKQRLKEFLSDKLSLGEDGEIEIG